MIPPLYEYDEEYLQDKPTYKKLFNEVKNSKTYGRKDLTEDLLYTLAVKEDATDNMIGAIFNLKGSQVKYMRDKYNMSNKSLKRMINHQELYLSFMKEHQQEIKDIPNDIYYEAIKIFASQKSNWKMDNYYNYLMEKLSKDNTILSDFIPIFPEPEDFNVTYETPQKTTNKKSPTKRINGHAINELELSKSKNKAGKIGERIVYFSEI